MNITLHKFLYRKHLLLEIYKHLIYSFYLIGQCVLKFCKITKTKIRFCCYPYWSLYGNDRKRNALFKPLSAKRFKLRKTFMESQRVSDSFANITVKIRSIKSKLKAYQTHFKYAMVKVTNLWKMGKCSRHRGAQFSLASEVAAYSPPSLSGCQAKPSRISRGCPWNLWNLYF